MKLPVSLHPSTKSDVVVLMADTKVREALKTHQHGMAVTREVPSKGESKQSKLPETVLRDTIDGRFYQTTARFDLNALKVRRFQSRTSSGHVLGPVARRICRFQRSRLNFVSIKGLESPNEYIGTRDKSVRDVIDSVCGNKRYRESDAEGFSNADHQALVYNAHSRVVHAVIDASLTLRSGWVSWTDDSDMSLVVDMCNIVYTFSSLGLVVDKGKATVKAEKVGQAPSSEDTYDDEVERPGQYPRLLGSHLSCGSRFPFPHIQLRIIQYAHTAPTQHNTQQLTGQLRSLGLYAAPTLGDGNCLFRALSDQLYGSPSHHMQLRRDICDWIEHHRQRYDIVPRPSPPPPPSLHTFLIYKYWGHVYVGTYGGHLELSAFAHFARRNVKVIQPGLVYVIEWNAGAGDEADTSARGLVGADEASDAREKRRLRRQQKRGETCGEAVQEESPEDTLYVAYHDWEHFSSVRNLRGPHAGLPHVCELSEDVAPRSPLSTPTKRKPTSRVTSKPATKASVSKSVKRSSVKVKAKEVTVPASPALIPLPNSRSPSPDASDCLTQAEADPTPPIPVAVHPELMPPGSAPLRVHRSPKRSFDESSGSSLSDVVAKRTRSSLSRADDYKRHDATEVEDPAEESTPELSAPGSSNSSPLSSPASSPRPTTPSPPEPVEKRITRRERKALGLPKPRSALMAKKASATGAGVIVIPGGRYSKKSGGNSKSVMMVRVMGDDEEGSVQDEEWQRNGTGRLDIRGFRELRI
ncbi:hypothetical protein BKA82DRAFT_31016 [Pisolithus tinctorius]|nr:hypothetical protein BKA82DRAFT_31016 [Pisolithus tinctorius]